MSFVREKVSRSSDEGQETKFLSVVGSAKPSDESQETKLLSVVGSAKPSDESQEIKLLSVVWGQITPEVVCPKNHIEEARL